MNIAKNPIFIFRIYSSILIFFYYDQINCENCEIHNIYFENIFKFIDFFLLRPNKLRKLRNSQYIY